MRQPRQWRKARADAQEHNIQQNRQQQQTSEGIGQGQRTQRRLDERQRRRKEPPTAQNLAHLDQLIDALQTELATRLQAQKTLVQDILRTRTERDRYFDKLRSIERLCEVMPQDEYTPVVLSYLHIPVSEFEDVTPSLRSRSSSLPHQSSGDPVAATGHSPAPNTSPAIRSKSPLMHANVTHPSDFFEEPGMDTPVWQHAKADGTRGDPKHKFYHSPLRETVVRHRDHSHLATPDTAPTSVVPAETQDGASQSARVGELLSRIASLEQQQEQLATSVQSGHTTPPPPGLLDVTGVDPPSYKSDHGVTPVSDGYSTPPRGAIGVPNSASQHGQKIGVRHVRWRQRTATRSSGLYGQHKRANAYAADAGQPCGPEYRQPRCPV